MKKVTQHLLFFFLLATVGFTAVLGVVDGTNLVTIENNLPVDLVYRVLYKMGPGVS